MLILTEAALLKPGGYGVSVDKTTFRLNMYSNGRPWDELYYDCCQEGCLVILRQNCPTYENEDRSIESLSYEEYRTAKAIVDWCVSHNCEPPRSLKQIRLKPEDYKDMPSKLQINEDQLKVNWVTEMIDRSIADRETWPDWMKRPEVCGFSSTSYVDSGLEKHLINRKPNINSSRIIYKDKKQTAGDIPRIYKSENCRWIKV